MKKQILNFCLVFVSLSVLLLPSFTKAEGTFFNYQNTWSIDVQTGFLNTLQPHIFQLSHNAQGIFGEVVNYSFLYKEMTVQRNSPLLFVVYRRNFENPAPCLPIEAPLCLGRVIQDACHSFLVDQQTQVLFKIQIPAMVQGQTFSAQGNFTLNGQNGFVPLEESLNNIFYQYELSDGTLVANPNINFCSGNIPFKVGNPNVGHADLTIQNINFENSIPFMNNPHAVVFDVVNIGNAATVYETQVCLDKRNVAPGLSVGDGEFSVCKSVPILNPGERKVFVILYNPLQTNFFSAIEGLMRPNNHPNRTMSFGKNRLGIVVNKGAQVLESNQNNNEEIINVNVPIF
jgi:hypothetical protein